MADTLFNFDEEQVVNDGPVTCLGIRFENDAKRREFFREELRKKLPELRLIEGFPVGTDDDIIALSDPPYYTACPNPWINDFIKEWEAEKPKLQAEKKRSATFEVKEPYAADVSEGKNNPIYMAHAYHTKVPHPAIMRYILHYTQPGDTVFDGFCGTGMTGVAANMCGVASDVNSLGLSKAKVGVRHGICSDLSPIASLISAAYTSKFNSIKFKKNAESILEQVESEYGWMYDIKVDGKPAKMNYVIWSDVFICHSCGEEIVLWDQAVDLEGETMNDEFCCPHCGASCSKKNMKKAWETVFDPIAKETSSMNKRVPVRVNYTSGGKRREVDISHVDFESKKIEAIDISGYPSTKLVDGFNTSQPINSNGVTYTHQFYSKRNFIYLNRIRELVKGDIFLETWLTSALQNASNMYKFRMDRKGGILNGTLFIPSLTIEQNPYRLLKAKINDFTAIAYQTRGNAVVGVSSATALSNIKDNSIDYMFIDPPFGANIMYSELSSIWESYIGVFTNNKEEAIINSYQNKTLFDYQELMNHSLKEFYRILKPGKWLTMEFSNTSAAVWNSIQNALQGVGFVVVNVAALDKKQGSFKAVTSPTAVKQDLIITCYKPTDSITNKFISSNGSANNLWDFIEDLLEHLPVHLKRENATTAVVERSPKILFDRLIAYYVQHGYQVPIDAAEFQKGLKDRFVERDGMFFTAEQAIEYEDKKKETTSFVSLALLVGSEAEGIEWLKRKLEDGPKTYSQILPDWMQDLVKPKKGDTLPELMQILDENFLKDENGYWHIPDLNDQAQLDAVRNKRLLKEFEVYIEAKKVKNARLEALRAGFKECYKNKDFATIVAVGDKIDEELLTTDEVLLRFYDIASSRV
jgi:DNA modification methylase